MQRRSMMTAADPAATASGRDGIAGSRGLRQLAPVMPREMAWATLDDRIDQALGLTFPASDPPAWQSIS